jgi:hypothetical protein
MSIGAHASSQPLDELVVIDLIREGDRNTPWDNVVEEFLDRVRRRSRPHPVGQFSAFGPQREGHHGTTGGCGWPERQTFFGSAHKHPLERAWTTRLVMWITLFGSYHDDAPGHCYS